MARKLTVGVNWQGKPDFKGTIERAKIADAAGIHSIWVAEAWGRDAFTLLTLLDEHTKKIQLATSIVNIYSRTPAALAQHFATLDELSEGRMLIAGTPLNYQGKLFKLSRGFTLRFEPVRRHIPIWVASLNPRSVEFTARQADGWLPVMIPLSGLQKAIGDFRAIAKEAGREPSAVQVKAPGHVTVTNNPDRARAAHAGTVAFYAARMGTFYSEQLTRYGFGADVAKVKEAWAAGGAKEGTAAVSPKLLSELGYIGGVEGAIDRLKAQDEAGVDLHPVEIDAASPAEFEKIVAKLL